MTNPGGFCCGHVCVNDYPVVVRVIDCNYIYTIDYIELSGLRNWDCFYCCHYLCCKLCLFVLDFDGCLFNVF